MGKASALPEGEGAERVDRIIDRVFILHDCSAIREEFIVDGRDSGG